jgi:hypothetical protein
MKEKARNVALTALKEDTTLDFVIKITGFAKEELLEMQKELQK